MEGCCTFGAVQPLESLRFVVVGDLMVDRYLYGRAERISPEAPVPILLLEREESRLGGAANVALNLRALGCQVEMAGVVGSDAAGEILREEARRQGIGLFALVEDTRRPTTTKTRLIAHHQHLLRVDREVTNPLSPPQENALLQKVRFLLSQKPHALILEDYNKGVLTPSVIRALIEAARTENIPILVDPKRDNFWAYERVTVFKPNLRELGEALGRKLSADLTCLQEAIQELRARMPHQHTVVTLSEEGVVVADDKGSFRHVPAHKRQIVDVSGAGDTVVSVLAVGVAWGLPIMQAAALANLAGGLVCEYVGVVPVPKDLWIAQAKNLGLWPES